MFLSKVTLVVFTLSIALPAAAADGKAVFTEHKCNQCHSVKSQKIDATEPDGKDLSEVGSKRESKWLKAYLLKEEAIDGKKHKKKFRGEDAELDALVAWLASLKKS